jgi:uncharacterized protein YndB with AHSA1/START domain
MAAGGRDDPRTAAFFINRTIDAKREKVWAALSEAAHLRQWWPASGEDSLNCVVDFRVGGMFLCGTSGAEAGEVWVKHVYREIWSPSQIVYVASFCDARGNLRRNPASPDWPIEVLTTIGLDKSGAGTGLTLRALPQNATDAERMAFDEDRFGLRDGFSGWMERLANHVAG